MKNRFVNFKPASLHIQTNNWEVIYYVEHPQTKKLVRKRSRINHIKSITARRQYAYKLITELNKKLAEGWNPYIEQEAPRAFHLLKDAFELFYKLKKKELKDSSYQTYLSVFTNFKEWLETQFDYNTLYVYSVDNNIANKYFQDFYLKKGNSERTFNNNRSALITIWNWFVENGYSKVNVFLSIRKKKEKPKTRKVIDKPTLQVIFEYLQENDMHFYTVCLVTYYGLIRGGELLQLIPSDIDLNNNKIIIRAEVSKNGRRRLVTIPNKLKEALLKYKIHTINKKHYIFSERFKPGKKMLTSRAITSKWDRLRDKLELPKHFHFYSLKDTGIVEMLRIGIPPNVVRDQAGHVDISITNTYIQAFMDKANDDIIEKFD